MSAMNPISARHLGFRLLFKGCLLRLLIRGVRRQAIIAWLNPFYLYLSTISLLNKVAKYGISENEYKTMIGYNMSMKS